MKKIIIILITIYLFQGIIHNLGHPVTSYFLEEIGIPDYMFGIFFAMMSLGLSIGGPIWGILGDRGNKRIYMFSGLILYSIGQYGFAFSGNAGWMVFFRFLSGFGVAASVTLLISHTIEHSTDKNRGYNLAFMAAAFTLGASIGYFIGGNLSSYFSVFDNHRNVFTLQALLNVVHASVMFLLIIDSKDRKTAERTTVIDGFKSIRYLNGTLIVFLISLTFITVGTINISKFIDVYFRDLGYTPSELGNFVAITGIVSLLSSIILVPLILSFKRNMLAMKIIQVLCAVIIFIVFRSENIMIVLYTLFMVYVAIKAVYVVLEQNFISGYASEGEYGKIMGVRQAFFAIGMVIGPIVAGWLYYIKPIYVFDFSVTTFIIGFILLLFVSRNLKQKKLAVTE